MPIVQVLTPEAVVDPARPLLGQNALVTGASRGIGRAIAIGLAKAGANVAINCRASREDAMRVAASVEDLGVESCVIPGDVRDPASLDGIRDDVHAHLGPVRILVNNAGINRDTRFRNMDADAWDQVIDTNLTSVFRVTRAFLDDITASPGGRIISIASFVGQRGNFGQTNYAASKGGIISFTRALAAELARDGCTVNAIAPGFIETDMLANVPERVRDKLLAEIPMRRFGRPDEVAHAVAFLADPRSAYVTGEILNLNGGLYMG